MGEIIKFLIYAISMCAIELVINSLYNRKSITDNAGRNECMAFFILGLCMFCIFFVFKLQNNPTVTNGHLWMCLGVMAIGLLGIIRASKWKIAVNGNQMEIQRLFRKSIVLQISEIERVEIGKKNQLLLYASGKKLITIDFLTENYEYLEETLKRNGKY